MVLFSSRVARYNTRYLVKFQFQMQKKSFFFFLSLNMSEILHGTYTKKKKQKRFLVHLRLKFHWISYFFHQIHILFCSVLPGHGPPCDEELSGGGALPDIRDCTTLQIKCIVSIIFSLDWKLLGGRTCASPLWVNQSACGVSSEGLRASPLITV